MKRLKRYLILICTILSIFTILCSTEKILAVGTRNLEKIDIIFSDGDVKDSKTLFENFTIKDVEVNLSGNVIVPGKSFNELTNGKINNEFEKLDNETFYFENNGNKWAYTFTGWHIVGTDKYLPTKTMFQPGDLILNNILEEYVNNQNELELEAIWGKCYFIKNPYSQMVYSSLNENSYVGYGYDATASEKATLEVLNEGKPDSEKLTSLAPASSDDNDGSTPENAYSTIDGLYLDLAKEIYTNKTISRENAYQTVVMLAGDLDYIKDSKAKYKGYDTSAYFGQLTSNSSTRYVSVTFKSLQANNVTAYNLIYKPKNYYNHVYGNIRFDNINFLRITTGKWNAQDVGSEFQLFSESNIYQYFESTPRFNQSIPSGKASAIATFRPNAAELVVFNGGSVSTFQTSWSTNINESNNTFEWYVGRKGIVTGAIHCGTTSAYATTSTKVDVNFKLTITGGKVGYIYGASKASGSSCSGTREINIIGTGNSKSGEYDPSITNDIFGGADEAKLYGDVYLNILNCNNINNVYGGGNKYTATTYGNIYINIQNSKLKGDLFGGGKNANSEKDPKTSSGGDVHIDLIKSTVEGNIYGSGMGMSQTMEIADNVYSFNASTKWWENNLYPEGWEYPLGYDKDGNIDKNSKEYYPQYDPDTGYVTVHGYKSVSWTSHSHTSITFKYTFEYAYLSLATVENVEININNSTVGTSSNGKGNVYGGGSIAQVKGNTEINIFGTSTKIYGSVFGGGDGVSTPAGVVLYDIINKNSYVMPKYTVQMDDQGINPINVNTTNQSPSSETKSLGTFKWSNDVSLLDNETKGIDFDKKLIYSPNTEGLGKVVGNTVVNISAGTIEGIVYGGGNKGLVEGNTELNISGTAIIKDAYAGCNQADVYDSTSLNITGGTIENAFGGNNQSGKIKGNVYVNVIDGLIDTLYGGGNKANDEYTSIIEISGANITTMYGGGKQATVKNVEINTLNSPTINTLYGGGDLGNTLEKVLINANGGNITTMYGGGKEATVGSVEINTSNSLNIDTLYGGGDLGNTLGDVLINIAGGDIITMYGGGKQATVKNVNVIIKDNSTIDTIYGGGDRGNTIGNITLDVNGSEIGSLYGGANQADVEGIVSINVNDGSITTLYGGNNESGFIHGENISILSGGIVPTTGEIVININGGVMETLFGGGNRADDDYTTIINLNNGEITTLYGGGKESEVNVAVVNINGGIINNNLYGGGYSGPIIESTYVTIINGQIKGDVYGGGFAGTVDSTYVNITDVTSNGLILIGKYEVIDGINTPLNGKVFGGGEGLSATVYSSTEVIIDLKLNTTVTESIFTLDHLSGKSETTATIDDIEYSKILGNVYGGGDLGQVGRGSINVSNNTATVSSLGTTTVLVKNGYIGGSVFGGGSGIPKGETRYDIKMGTIFGITNTTINGGFIEGNVYGGGTQSRLYGPENVEKVAVVNIEELAENIIIRGSVFGGGDRGNSATTNASVPTTIGNVEVNILGSSSLGTKIYFLTGGVYGDGNLCLVNGERTINMVNFSTGSSNLKTFYSLQRADFVNVDNCDFVLLGAVDLVEEGDVTVYSINRIGELNMKNGSVIKLDQIVKYLEAITSDVEYSRKFVINGNNGSSGNDLPDELDPLTETEIEEYINQTGNYSDINKNVICVANGLYLEIIQENNEYGSVKGLFTLQLLRAIEGEGGGFVYSSITTSTGDFICETKLIAGGKEMVVIDSKGGVVNNTSKYYCWYIQGKVINYTISINGYIGSEEEAYSDTTILPEHDIELIYILNTLVVNNIFENAIKDGKYQLVQKNKNLSGQEIALELKCGTLSFYLEYTAGVWTINSKTGFNNNGDLIRYNVLAENIKVDSSNNQFDIILHKSKEVNAEITNMQVEVGIGVYTKDYVEHSGTSKLNYKIGFSIIRLVPVQEMYIGSSKNYTGLVSSEEVKITLGSSLTIEYQTRYIPSAFPKTTNQMIWELTTESYSHYLDSLGNYLTIDSSGNVINISSTLTLDPNVTNKVLVTKNASGEYEYEENGETIKFVKYTSAYQSFIPKGTKIIMIDTSIASSPGYYYYICDENKTSINLKNFMKMGTSTSINNGATAEFVKFYESGQASRITERLVFIFDFEQVDSEDLNTIFTGNILLAHKYGNNTNGYIDIMDYVKTDVNLNNTTYTRAYPKVATFEMSNDKLEDGIAQFEMYFEENEYFANDVATLIVNTSRDDVWTNTKLIDGKIGIIIEPALGGKLPDGIEFIYKGTSYYPLNKNKYVIIPLNDFGTHTIEVRNILGTIKTTTSADFIGTLSYLPTTQFYNGSFLISPPKQNFECDILEPELGSMLVELENHILTTNDTLTVNITLNDCPTTDVSISVYIKTPNGYIDIPNNFPPLNCNQGENEFIIGLSRLGLEAGTYKLIFTNGTHIESMMIIITEPE